MQCIDVQTEFKPSFTNKLFPDAPFPNTFENPDPFLSTGICAFVRVKLSWRDRLRILFSGKCAIKLRIETDKPCEALQSRSNFYVLAPNAGI